MKNKNTGSNWKIRIVDVKDKNVYFRLFVEIIKDYEKRNCFVDGYTSDQKREIHITELSGYSIGWQVAILQDLAMIEEKVYSEVLKLSKSFKQDE